MHNYDTFKQILIFALRLIVR